MLGVATLIVVLSVMNGFERELRTRILSVTAHGTLIGIDGALTDWRDVQQAAQQRPGVVAAVPFIESESMLANGATVTGAMVRGDIAGGRAQGDRHRGAAYRRPP